MWERFLPKILTKFREHFLLLNISEKNKNIGEYVQK